MVSTRRAHTIFSSCLGVRQKYVWWVTQFNQHTLCLNIQFEKLQFAFAVISHF